MQFYGRWPSKSTSVTGVNEFTITFPVKTSTLETGPILKTTVLEIINQTLFTHVLVND